MDKIKNSLKTIEESLKQTLSFYETNKKFFRKISKGKDSGFDFEDFDKLDIFEKCDKENLYGDFKNDAHESLAKAYKSLNSVLKNLDDNRAELHNEYMDRLRNMSHEIHAIRSVQAFLKYWDNKLLDDYQLTEYPLMFKNFFEKIPIEKRDEIAKMISTVKPLQQTENSCEQKTVLNELNKNNIFNKESSDSTFETNQTFSNSLKSRFSTDAGEEIDFSKISLPFHLKNVVETHRDHFTRGHTVDIGLSVLDFTLPNQPVSSNTSFENGANGQIAVCQDYLNESTISNDPLNNAIHNMDESMDVEDNDVNEKNVEIKDVKPELPSFLEDSARCPEIEHAHLDLDSWSQIQFDTSIHCSMNRSIQENSVQVNDESSFITDQSIINMQLEHLGNESDCSIEMSLVDIDYSFNQTRPR